MILYLTAVLLIALIQHFMFSQHSGFLLLHTVMPVSVHSHSLTPAWYTLIHGPMIIKWRLEPGMGVIFQSTGD